MTEYVDGKRYRVMRDYGVLTFNAELETFQREGWSVWAGDSSITAEPVPDPLPTRRGSVVRYNFYGGMYTTAMLNGAGWTDDAGATMTADEMAAEAWTLIYDAGAAL